MATPDLGRYQPFPDPTQRPLRARDIAVNIGGAYYPTRAGLERLAHQMGYGVEYIDDPRPVNSDPNHKQLICSLRRGEHVIGGVVGRYHEDPAAGRSQAVLSEVRTQALREALRIYAPDVLERARAILDGTL